MTSKQVVIQGCVFTEIHNGTAYELTRYTGNAPRLKIPASLGDNKPVVRIADYAFDGCSSITDIILLDGITEIGDYAFRNCTSLTNVKIPQGVLKKGRDIFAGCIKLHINDKNSQLTSSVSFSPKQVLIQGCVFTEINNGTAYELTRYTGNAPRLKIPAFLGDNKPVLRIADYAFDGCTSLTDVIILDGITTIGDCAFRNCTSLKNVTIPVTAKMQGHDIFMGCINGLVVNGTEYFHTSPKPITKHGDLKIHTNDKNSLNKPRYTPYKIEDVTDSDSAKSSKIDSGTTTYSSNQLSYFQKFTKQINELAGGKGSISLNIRELFSNVFHKHTTDDAGELFQRGFTEHTPSLDKISSALPKPWFFAWVFGILFVAFILMYFTLITMNNAGNLIPGVFLLGSFLVPFTLLFFFFEINKPCNINILTVIVVFLIGGCASLIITLMLGSIFPDSIMCFVDEDGIQCLSVSGALITGIVEEISKAVIVVGFFLINRPKLTKNFILNGLLIGAAVGVGFSAFESAGYAFGTFLESGDIGNMFYTIFLRGFLAPGGHIIWAAITGAALMMAAGSQPVRLEHVMSRTFLIFFGIVVGMHAMWDMPFSGIPGAVVLMILGMIITFILIFAGFEQIERLKLKPEIMR